MKYLIDTCVISETQKPTPDRKRPAWFGSVKVDADLPHDMASIRRSVGVIKKVN